MTTKDMTSAEYFDQKWREIIPKMPAGGPYRYDLRKHGYQIIVDYINGGSSVFDYACGLPIISKMLADQKGFAVSGCDISPVAIEYAKSIFYDFYIGEEILGHYDYIIASYFLEHIKDPVGWLQGALMRAPEVICSLPNNFKHTGEHVLMAWASWDEFNDLFKDFFHYRIDIGKYPADLKKDFQHPIVIFKNK